MGSDQKKIYYVVIAALSAADHLQLRRVINRMLPQAIVESLHTPAEYQVFLNQSSRVPDLIFTDDFQVTDKHALMQGLSENEVLRNVPVIIIGDEAEESKAATFFANKHAYFKRTFSSNSLEWLARNLLCKFNRLQESPSF